MPGLMFDTHLALTTVVGIWDLKSLHEFFLFLLTF